MPKNERPRLVAGMIVRNEEKRYLKEVLERLSEISDKIVVVDDASTDKTVEICKSFDKVILKRENNHLFEKDEALLRTHLWNEIRKLKPLLVLICDADEIVDLSIRDILDEMDKEGFMWTKLRLLDMWDKEHYRIDGLWSPVMLRLFKFMDKPFGRKGRIHCACFPSYVDKCKNGTCYSDVRIKHMAWATQEDRERKYKVYSEKYTPEELGQVNFKHLQSVLDLQVDVMKFQEPIYYPRVLVTSLLRDREWCLDEFLEGLYSQDYPKDRLSLLLLANNCVDKTIPMLKEWASKHKDEYASVRVVERTYPETKEEGEHVWSADKIHYMIEMRNYCLENIGINDFVFNLDSDVVLQYPRTIRHLAFLDKDIITEVFWAKWGKLANPPMANVWARGFYEYTWDFFGILRQKGIYPVGGGGACTLISKRVIKMGVNFSPVYNLPSNMVGEDRNLNIRAAVYGFQLYVSSYFTPIHLEYEVYKLRQKFIEWKEARKPKETLSLAMICKNEASFLPVFFTEYAWLFDEIIMVDTQSSDDSKKIAESFGVKVFDFEGQWKGNENLGEARNQAIRRCKSTWVMQLDPDEVLPEPILVRDIIEETPMDCFLFEVANIQENQRYTISDSIRLYRNNKGFFYTGLCHETIEDSIKDRKLENGEEPIKVGRFPKPLVHHGYLKGHSYVQQKLDLYLAMNERQRKNDPKDPRPYFNLALHYINDGDEDMGIKYMKKAIELKPDFMLPIKELGMISLRRSRNYLQNAAALAHPNSAYGRSIRQILNGLDPLVSDGIVVGDAARNKEKALVRMKEEARQNRLKEPGFYK